MMPVMDGMETSRRIQADPRFKDLARLLLTSAINLPAPQELDAAGIRRVMEKPTLPADLLKVYKELLAQEPVQAEALTALSRRTLPALSILVAEDNTVNQMVITGILQRLGQNPEIVSDGAEAVQRFRSGARYDLVLMDCEMPKLNGLDATREIRSFEEERHRASTPIVALSAHAVQSQVEACYAAGMNAYLSKPVDVENSKHC